MQIGQVATPQENQQHDFAYSLVNLWWLGSEGSKLMCQDHMVETTVEGNHNRSFISQSFM